MALYLTHPSSMVGRIVHKGDVFVNGNDVYVAKREIDRIVYSIRNKRDIHVMVHDEDDDDEIIADIGELNENDE